MADGFQRLIQAAQTRWPNLKWERNPEWGSLNPDHRKLIRHSISEKLNPSGKWSNSESILSLEHPPRPSDFSVSISHTVGLGGWMAIERPQQVGFDIEVRTRVPQSVIARVCSASEIQLAGENGVELWCAKEAIFKALESQQPKVISQIQFLTWKEDELQDLRVFTGKVEGHVKSVSMTGLSTSDHDFSYALCVIDVSD